MFQEHWFWRFVSPRAPSFTQKHHLWPDGQHCTWWRARAWQGDVQSPCSTQGNAMLQVNLEPWLMFLSTIEFRVTIALCCFTDMSYTEYIFQLYIGLEWLTMFAVLCKMGEYKNWCYCWCAESCLWFLRQGTQKWYEMQDLHVTDILPQMIPLSESYIQVGKL